MTRLAVLVCAAACGCAQPVDPRSTTAAEPEAAPLKQWMTANLSRAVKTPDFEALGRALSALATGGPPELGGWADIAERGAHAAAARDIERVRQSCADCHRTHRAEYRERFRARPFPRHDTQQGEPR